MIKKSNGVEIMKSVYEIGKNYLVRTVTMIYTGNLKVVTDTELVFTQCCWISETERWMEAVAESRFREVEPYPKNSEVIIGRSAIVDAVQIKVLPFEQK